MTHTPGPLRFAKQGSGFQFSAGKLLDPTDKLIGFISGVTKWRRGEAEANAHRIVATWNACEGMSTGALETGVVTDLLGACEALVAWHDSPSTPDDLTRLYGQAITAITRAKQGQEDREDADV